MLPKTTNPNRYELKIRLAHHARVVPTRIGERMTGRNWARLNLKVFEAVGAINPTACPTDAD